VQALNDSDAFLSGAELSDNNEAGSGDEMSENEAETEQVMQILQASIVEKIAGAAPGFGPNTRQRVVEHLLPIALAGYNPTLVDDQCQDGIGAYCIMLALGLKAQKAAKKLIAASHFFAYHSDETIMDLVWLMLDDALKRDCHQKQILDDATIASIIMTAAEQVSQKIDDHAERATQLNNKRENLTMAIRELEERATERKNMSQEDRNKYVMDCIAKDIANRAEKEALVARIEARRIARKRFSETWEEGVRSHKRRQRFNLRWKPVMPPSPVYITPQELAAFSQRYVSAPTPYCRDDGCSWE